MFWVGAKEKRPSDLKHMLLDDAHFHVKGLPLLRLSKEIMHALLCITSLVSFFFLSLSSRHVHKGRGVRDVFVAPGHDQCPPSGKASCWRHRGLTKESCGLDAKNPGGKPLRP